MANRMLRVKKGYGDEDKTKRSKRREKVSLRRNNKNLKKSDKGKTAKRSKKFKF